jgi:hypothetical protein
MGTGIQKRGEKKKVFWSAHPLRVARGAIDCPQLADQSSSHSRTYGNKVEIRKQLLNFFLKKGKIFIIIFKENGLINK